MALLYLLDENLRGGALWHALQRHNALGANPIDVVRVGDPPDLPCGTPDPQVLLWAEQRGRVLVSFDVTTMPGHLAGHLAAGQRSPGVFLILPGHRVHELVDELVLRAHTSPDGFYADRIDFIP